MRLLVVRRCGVLLDGPFDKLSDDLRRRFFGREYFHRAVPPWQEGTALEDSVLG